MDARALNADQLDAAFSALADRTRRAIIQRLTHGEASVLELAQPFAMSQPAISKHLKVLEQAGLISRSKEAQRRPCRLEPDRLREVSEYLGSYREFWEHAYDQLDVLLEELKANERIEASVPKTPKETNRERKKTRNRRPAR